MSNRFEDPDLSRDEAHDSDASDDDASDTEDEKEESVEALVTRILEHVQGPGPKNARDFESEWPRLAEMPNTNDKENALHLLAKGIKKKLDKDTKLDEMIAFLVRHDKNLLSWPNRHGFTPLWIAIDEKKESLVRWMCDATKPENIDSVLRIADDKDKKNCIHLAIGKRLKYLDSLIGFAKPETLAAQDADGNTALHHAVDYKRCREGQLAIVQLIVSRSDKIAKGEPCDFNKANQSPYLYHFHTRRKALDKASKEKEPKRGATAADHSKEKDKKEKDMKEKEKISIPLPGMMPNGTAKQQQTVTNSLRQEPSKYGNRGLTPAGLAANGTLTAEIVPDQRSKSESKGSEAKEKKGESSSRSKPDEKTARDIQQFLKLHYVRSRPYDTCMEILYGVDTPSDMQLFFDLSGHDNLKFSDKSFKAFLDKLDFSDVLQYVSIPKVPVITSRKGDARKPKGSAIGRDDLVFVFKCLRDKGVKTILTVMVGDTPSEMDKTEDAKTHPHTDEAIETALQDFGVEVWDWKKPDICSEVIWSVAPNVREVHLYWNGNNAVLRGWAEPGGLQKLGKLERVFISTEERLESEDRTGIYMAQFIQRMQQLCPKASIELKDSPYRRHMTLLSHPRGALDQAKQQTKDEWIKCMTDFYTLLNDAKNNSKIESDSGVSMTLKDCVSPGIKIALIDDGVDYKDLPDCNFIGGQSFSTRDRSRNLIHPFYASSIGHGTAMARHIYFMCPGAEIYVLRLDDYPDMENPNIQRITAKSAAKAIKAAVRKGVDIISMSWTIEPSGTNSKDDQDLERAISAAAAQGILMFCSAPDRGAKQTDTFPSKAAPGRIFTIGAASTWGNSVPAVGSLDGITFTLPGDKVSIPGIEKASIPYKDGVSGSSVATALGAGLAALILYCVKVHYALTKPGPEKDRIQEDFEALKKHENMLKAINGIGITPDTKFVMVWNVFAPKGRQKKEWSGGNEYTTLIGDVGRVLCTKLL